MTSHASDCSSGKPEPLAMHGNQYFAGRTKLIDAGHAQQLKTAVQQRRMEIVTITVGERGSRYFNASKCIVTPVPAFLHATQRSTVDNTVSLQAFVKGVRREMHRLSRRGL